MSDAVDFYSGAWWLRGPMFRQASGAFASHLARRRKTGQQVSVLRHPYWGGLYVRATLDVDGQNVRIHFDDNEGWRKS